MNIIGLSKQRNEIESLISDIPSATKKLSQLICERIMLVENEIDKLDQKNNLDIEKFFNDNLIELLEIISNKNLNDSEWDDKTRKSILKIVLKFFEELKKIYISGQDGAKYCLEFNIETILNDLIGEDLIKILKQYNEDFIIIFLENLISIAQNTNFDDINNKNNNKLLLSMEEIFNLASRDKKKIENEKKEEKNEENKENKEGDDFSEFYKRTSLFQN